MARLHQVKSHQTMQPKSECNVTRPLCTRGSGTISTAALSCADKAPPAAEGTQRCKQCLKAKPIASFVRDMRSLTGATRGDFCMPCIQTIKQARTRRLTAAEVIDMVIVQDDYDMKPAETQSMRQCNFCLRTKPTVMFGRLFGSVRNAAQCSIF